VLHLFARFRSADDHGWTERAAAATAGLAETEVWTDVLVDFTAPGVTEVAGLQRYCTARRIDPALVMAIGDMSADARLTRGGRRAAHGRPRRQ
jgi:hydroxymethylpyrimidine pyrophosphatase-like HAD family hydrolase